MYRVAFKFFYRPHWQVKTILRYVIRKGAGRGTLTIFFENFRPPQFWNRSPKIIFWIICMVAFKIF